MKPKKFEKKLALNKKSVANLNDRELNNVRGGATYTCYVTNCPATYFDWSCIKYWTCVPCSRPCED
jgi:natural product precursor